MSGDELGVCYKNLEERVPPIGTMVKLACSALEAQGSLVWIPGADA